GGKNLLGTFHQPRAVLIDPLVLGTLPEREFRAGLYESLKCGVIGNPELFEFLEKADVKQLRRNREKIEWVIAQSVKLKAKVVSSDERESGLRRVLNFGHTIGHALEAETNYRYFLHGEAVAWGMIAAAHISTAVGRLDQRDATRIRNAVLNLGPLPKVKVREVCVAVGGVGSVSAGRALGGQVCDALGWGRIVWGLLGWGRLVWGRLVWGRLVWGRLVWGRLVWGRLVWGRVSDPSSRAQLGISEIVFVLNRERPIQKRSSWRFA